MYHTPVVDIVPDHNPINVPRNAITNIRADYSINVQFLQNWLDCKNGNVLTINSEIPLNIFSYFKKNIEQINLEVNESTSEEYVSDLFGLGIRTQLVSKDKESLQKLRLKFIDYMVNDVSPKKPPSKISKNIKKLKIKSSKEVYSMGKPLPSKFHYYESIGESKMEYLWEDLDHLIFYSEK